MLLKMFTRQLCFIARAGSLNTFKYLKNARVVLPSHQFSHVPSTSTTQQSNESLDDILQTYKSQHGTDIILNSDTKQQLTKVFTNMSTQVVSYFYVLLVFMCLYTFQIIKKIVTTDKEFLPAILRNPEMTSAILALQLPYDIAIRFVHLMFL
jgi:hypothetical protein